MFDQKNLSRSEQMLRDKDTSQGIFGIATGVANNVGVAEKDAKS